MTDASTSSSTPLKRSASENSVECLPPAKIKKAISFAEEFLPLPSPESYRNDYDRIKSFERCMNHWSIKHMCAEDIINYFRAVNKARIDGQHQVEIYLFSRALAEADERDTVSRMFMLLYNHYDYFDEVIHRPLHLQLLFHRR